ncbi:MAG: AMP-binding protein [Planctomycetes bacterium]|nr:AMP-binding protein [Planctomycetota bacterium]
MLVQEFLEAAAGRTPDKVALVCDERRHTHRELDEAANRLAHTLRAGGVRRGDRVVLWAGNGVELVVAIFAVLKADAVFVVLHESSKPDQVAYVLDHCGATALLAPARRLAEVERWLGAGGPLAFAVLVGAVATTLPPRCLPFDTAVAAGAATRPERRGIDRDLACLVYTSGSTGEPKGVMCAHHHMVFASGSILAYLGLDADDVVLCALPLAFDYGLYQLLLTFRVGGRLVLERSFAYPAACLERIAAERVTVLPGVPTMFALLLAMDLAAFDLASLRTLTNTAAALPPAHVRQLARAFPGTRLFSMYGLTETKRTLWLPPELLDAHPGSVGIAIPGTEVWLEDEQGRRLGCGEVGELVVRGGHVMAGYWNDPAATAARFPPGPLPGERVCRTGDLFRRDANGLHWFVGRRDDVLKSRGEKVAPKEVEDVLHDHPGVQSAALVGVPDAVLGTALVAVVVRADRALRAQDVLRHCRERLQDFKVPQRVHFVDSLPRSANGKVLRQAIDVPPAE